MHLKESEEFSIPLFLYQYSFPIDTTHDWKASMAEIDVWGLQRLYVVNGTFEEGVPGYTINPNTTLDSYPFGWNAAFNSTDPDQVHLVSYDDTGSRYISVQYQQVGSNAAYPIRPEGPAGCPTSIRTFKSGKSGNPNHEDERANCARGSRILQRNRD